MRSDTGSQIIRMSHTLFFFSNDNWMYPIAMKIKSNATKGLPEKQNRIKQFDTELQTLQHSYDGWCSLTVATFSSRYLQLVLKTLDYRKHNIYMF